MIELYNYYIIILEPNIGRSMSPFVFYLYFLFLLFYFIFFFFCNHYILGTVTVHSKEKYVG